MQFPYLFVSCVFIALITPINLTLHCPFLQQKLSLWLFTVGFDSYAHVSLQNLREARAKNLRSSNCSTGAQHNCKFNPFSYVLLVFVASYRSLPAHRCWLLLRIQIQLPMPKLQKGIKNNGATGFFCPPRHQQGTKR